MHRKLFGTTRRRVLAITAALAALLGAGFGAASLASAATDFGPGKVKGALVAIDSTAARGIYIDGNGIPHCLPAGPNAVAGKSGDYAGMWFSVSNPSCAFGPGATAVTPPPIADGEAAPVLALNGAATPSTVRIKWSDATPGDGESIQGYVIERKVAGATWSPATITTLTATEATNGIQVTGLSPNTGYVFRVRAEYKPRSNETDGANGPWSNELTIRTAP